MRRGPLPFRYVFLLSVVFFILSTVTGLWLINAGIKPTLISYADTQTRTIATSVINSAINENISKNTQVEDYFIEVEGSSSYRDINTNKVNQVQTEIIQLIQENLKKAERGYIEDLQMQTDVKMNLDSSEEKGFVFRVPLGQATQNALLGNLGPEIPIRFQAAGDAKADLRAEITEFGINNSFLAIYADIQVNVEIIIPFATERATVNQSVLIASTIFDGEVPDFFYDNSEGGQTSGVPSPAIEFPLSGPRE